MKKSDCDKLLDKFNILLDSDLTKVSGGVTDEEAIAVSKMIQEVNNRYQEWLVKNTYASDAEKVYQYQTIIENVYNSLSPNERILINNYIGEISR